MLCIILKIFYYLSFVRKGKELRLKLYREEQDMLIYVETQKPKKSVESGSVFIDPDDYGTNWDVRLVSESEIQWKKGDL